MHALALERLRSHSPLVDRIHSDPDSSRWLELGLSALCNSAAIGLASYVESAVFVVANALWGAELLGVSIAELAARRGLRLRVPPTLARRLAWLVAGAGVYYQLVGRGARLPTPLRLALLCQPRVRTHPLAVVPTRLQTS